MTNIVGPLRYHINIPSGIWSTGSKGWLVWTLSSIYPLSHHCWIKICFMGLQDAVQKRKGKKIWPFLLHEKRVSCRAGSRFTEFKSLLSHFLIGTFSMKNSAIRETVIVELGESQPSRRNGCYLDQLLKDNKPGPGLNSLLNGSISKKF